MSAGRTARCVVTCPPHELETLEAAGAGDRRHGEQEREADGCLAAEPERGWLLIVVPDREIPGSSANAWATPTARVCQRVIDCSASSTVLRVRAASSPANRISPFTIRQTAATIGSVRHRFDPMVEAEPGDARGDGREADEEPEPAVLEEETPHLAAEHDQDCGKRGDVDDDREQERGFAGAAAETLIRAPGARRC